MDTDEGRDLQKGPDDNTTAAGASLSRMGPVSRAALGTGGGARAPLVEEWEGILSDRRGYVLLWAGAFQGPKSPEASGEAFGWNWVQAAIEDTIADGDDPGVAKLLRPEAAKWTERLLSPLAHEARIRILQALWSEGLTSTDLAAATDMSGGNLYYHVKELVHGQYVMRTADGYALTGLGRQLLLTLVLVASHVVPGRDRGGEPLRAT